MYYDFTRKIIGRIGALVIVGESSQEILILDGLGKRVAHMITDGYSPEDNNITRLKVLDFVEQVIAGATEAELAVDNAFLTCPLIPVEDEQGAENVLIPVRSAGPAGETLWVDAEMWAGCFSASAEDDTQDVIDVFNNILVEDAGIPDVIVRKQS